MIYLVLNKPGPIFNDLKDLVNNVEKIEFAPCKIDFF